MSVGIESGFPAIVKVVLDLGGLSQDSLNNYLTMATRSQAPAIVELLKAAGAKPIVLTEVKVAPEVLQGYVGTYRNERVAYSLLVKDTKLVIRIAPQREFSLTCTAAHTFESPEVPGVKLVFGAEGEKVTSLTVKEPSGDTLLKKVEVK